VRAKFSGSEHGCKATIAFGDESGVRRCEIANAGVEKKRDWMWRVAVGR
jgi:hypothetical protein